jgi:hypothetical protein
MPAKRTTTTTPATTQGLDITPEMIAMLQALQAQQETPKATTVIATDAGLGVQTPKAPQGAPDLRPVIVDVFPGDENTPKCEARIVAAYGSKGEEPKPYWAGARVAFYVGGRNHKSFRGSEFVALVGHIAAAAERIGQAVDHVERRACIGQYAPESERSTESAAPVADAIERF